MKSFSVPVLLRVLKLVTVLLIVRVTVGIVLAYGSYVPPDFESLFLLGRRHYFFGMYAVAFYTHIASGPCSLILGLILISEKFRRQFPKWHRLIGRTQVAIIVLLVTPSGLWMSRYADTGAVAGIGFASLAVATGTCAVLGWRSAVGRRFTDHRHWMLRCFVLLCSAVFLRIQGGVATISDWNNEWFYPQAAWSSWLVPLILLEVSRSMSSRIGSMPT